MRKFQEGIPVNEHFVCVCVCVFFSSGSLSQVRVKSLDGQPIYPDFFAADFLRCL